MPEDDHGAIAGQIVSLDFSLPVVCSLFHIPPPKPFRLLGLARR
jgi:hypothetical protein